MYLPQFSFRFNSVINHSMYLVIYKVQLQTVYQVGNGTFNFSFQYRNILNLQNALQNIRTCYYITVRICEILPAAVSRRRQQKRPVKHADTDNPRAT